MKKYLLTVVLIFVVSLTPLMMRAATATDLAATISSFTGGVGGSGSLTAIANDNYTVTVTGTLTTDATTGLTLDIDADVTVIWQAEISTGSGYTGNQLIYLPGAGTFNVATGGNVSATENGVSAIVSTGSTLIMVSGTGIVQATSDVGTATINTSGNVVVSGGKVSTTNDLAINAWSAGSSVTVSAGIVQATGDGGTAIGTNGNVVVSGGEVNATTGNAISTWSSNSTVNITDGTVSVTTGNAINASGSLTVSGSGIVQATGNGGTAISASGNVEVNGGEISTTTGCAINAGGASSTLTVSAGIVQATGDGGKAINSGGALTVSGSSIVQATGDGSTAILTSGNVEVSGGEVSATTGFAINSWTSDPTVITINGGTINVTTGNAILVQGDNSTVTVSGTGNIQATGNGGVAIVTSSNVEVSGGEVSATTGLAITANGASSTVTVSNGLVFAYGDAVTGSGNVIFLPNNSSGFTDATGTGVVVAWNQAAGNIVYTQGSSTDLSQSPASATVQWDKNGADYGISYTNGTNTGFIPLSVTVNSSACDVTSVESPAGATITGQTITASVANSVTSQAISLTTSPSASWKLYSDAACTNEITDKTMILSVGDNIAYIQVTAEDGTTTKVYTIVVTRAEALVLSVSPASLSFTASGEQQTFSISSNTDWTVSSSNSWLTVSPASGSNNGTVTVTAASNTSTSQRTATVTVKGTGVTTQTISIKQDAAPIISALSISPTSLNFAVSGESKAFAITSNTDWTVSSSASSWLTIAPSSGSNDGTVTVTAAQNTATSQRTATITVSGTGVTAQTISVTQDATPVVPNLSISLASLNFAASGEQQAFSIASNTDWIVSSDVSWLIVSPSFGFNDGTVTVTAAANSDSIQRTATITVSGTGVTAQTISITQDAAPTLNVSVSPSTLNFAASGEQQVLSITSNTSWRVSSDASWLTVSPISGSNDGSVTATAAENTATIQRTATITISGIISDINGDGILNADDLTTITTISVTQDAADIPSVIPNETQTVGTDGKGAIALNLSFPSDATLTGSFEIQFPAGMSLDSTLTVLSLALSGNFYLSFTAEKNNTWLIEIKSNALRSSTATEYTNIMTIAYTVNDSVSKGTYEASIMNLDFIQDNGTSIKEDLLTAPITVDRVATSIENIGNTSFYAYFQKNMLKIESSHAETITIYSATGVELYSAKKSADSIEIPLISIPGAVYIVKGSMSGTIKIIR